MNNFRVKLEIINLEDLVLVSDLGYSALGMLGYLGNARSVTAVSHAIQVTPHARLQEIKQDRTAIVRPTTFAPMPRLGNENVTAPRRSQDSASTIPGSLDHLNSSQTSGLQHAGNKKGYLTALARSLNGQSPSSELAPTGTFVQNEQPISLQGSNFSIATVQVPFNQLDQLANNLNAKPRNAKTGAPNLSSAVARSESSNYISQNVVINADNDNRSTVTYHIPQRYDFQASASQYQNANLENDLVQLQTTGFIPDDAQATPGFNWYQISVSNNGKGRIEVWDSPSKQHLIPFNVQTTAYMGLDPSGTPRYLPGFWMEGIHISEAVGDITVSVTVSQIVNNQSVQVDLTPVRISVTPVTLSLLAPDVVNPYFRNNANTSEGIMASMKAKIKFVRPLTGDVGFVQFWDKMFNLLYEDLKYFGIKRASLTDLREIILPEANQPPGPKLKLPFLDTTPLNIPIGPSTSDGLTNPPYTYVDYPNYTDTIRGVRWMKVGLSDYWSNYIVYYKSEYNEITIYPLYKTEWYVLWLFDTYVAGSGATTKVGSVTSAANYWEQHNFDTGSTFQEGQYATPNLARDVWGFEDAI